MSTDHIPGYIQTRIDYYAEQLEAPNMTAAESSAIRGFMAELAYLKGFAEGVK